MIATEKYSYTTCGVKARDRTKLVSVTGIVGLVLALIAYGLRMYSKTKTGFGWDDYVLSLSMVRGYSSKMFPRILTDVYSAWSFLFRASQLSVSNIPSHN